MNSIKRNRSLWLTDEIYRKLKEKAKRNGFEGKGSLERYFEEIANNCVLIIKTESKVNIIPIN